MRARCQLWFAGSTVPAISAGCFLLLVTGCGSAADVAVAPAPNLAPPPIAPPATVQRSRLPPPAADSPPAAAPPVSEPNPTGATAPEQAGLAPDAEPSGRVPPPSIDVDRAAAHGIRCLPSRHLLLFTDVRADPAVDELPLVFDQAVPWWCAYFGIPPDRAADWKLVGYLMHDKARFQAAGLLPADLPPFLHGFQRHQEFWVHEQSSAYFRRHLVLHEGTHGFMLAFLGGCGPPWYMEGMAELLATHRWLDHTLTLNYFPHQKQEVPDWGRIKVVKDDYGQQRVRSLADILAYGSTAHRAVEPYGWSWAACAFLDRHPAYQVAFRALARQCGDASSALTFSRRFFETIKADGGEFAEQRQWYVSHIDYGYDVAREAIEYLPSRPLLEEEATVTLRADRGWQSSGLTVPAGAVLEISATGRFQLADQPQVWWSEADGVTVRYHDGRPLGVLLAGVSDPTQALTGTTPLLSPAVIGHEGTLPVTEGGTLFFRINEPPSELADNAGTLAIRVRRRPPPTP